MDWEQLGFMLGYQGSMGYFQNQWNRWMDEGREKLKGLGGVTDADRAAAQQGLDASIGGQGYKGKDMDSLLLGYKRDYMQAMNDRDYLLGQGYKEDSDEVKGYVAKMNEAHQKADDLRSLGKSMGYDFGELGNGLDLKGINQAVADREQYLNAAANGNIEPAARAIAAQGGGQGGDWADDAARRIAGNRQPAQQAQAAPAPAAPQAAQGTQGAQGQAPDLDQEAQRIASQRYPFNAPPSLDSRSDMPWDARGRLPSVAGNSQGQAQGAGATADQQAEAQVAQAAADAGQQAQAQQAANEQQAQQDAQAVANAFDAHDRDKLNEAQARFTQNSLDRWQAQNGAQSPLLDPDWASNAARNIVYGNEAYPPLAVSVPDRLTSNAPKAVDGIAEANAGANALPTGQNPERRITAEDLYNFAYGQAGIDLSQHPELAYANVLDQAAQGIAAQRVASMGDDDIRAALKAQGIGNPIIDRLLEERRADQAKQAEKDSFAALAANATNPLQAAAIRALFARQNAGGKVNASDYASILSSLLPNYGFNNLDLGGTYESTIYSKNGLGGLGGTTTFNKSATPGETLSAFMQGAKIQSQERMKDAELKQREQESIRRATLQKYGIDTRNDASMRIAALRAQGISPGRGKEPGEAKLSAGKEKLKNQATTLYRKAWNELATGQPYDGTSVGEFTGWINEHADNGDLTQEEQADLWQQASILMGQMFKNNGDDDNAAYYWDAVGDPDMLNAVLSENFDEYKKG